MRVGFFVLGLIVLAACTGSKRMTAASDARQGREVACIGFWNLENLFDTIDNKGVWDTEFTPSGKRHYGTRIYYEKLTRLAEVISGIGTEITPDGVAVLGVSEVENIGVLKDLVKQERVDKRDYQIIHRNSPDERGIDVALLYQPKYFVPTNVETKSVTLFRHDGSRDYTRDVLHVEGKLLGEPMHFLINHWPSRSGGEEVSRSKRDSAAAVARRIIDKIYTKNPHAKIIVLGDFNDNPNNESILQFLKASPDKTGAKDTGLFNTTYGYYKSGIGTTAYRDAWSLFDQAIVSYPLLVADQGWKYVKTKIYNHRFMINPMGKYKGYPKRSFVGDAWQGGYSDHFPVYLYVTRKK